MADILIVAPRYSSLRRESYYEFPLGLAYVSSCLRAGGHSVAALNLNHGNRDPEEVLAERLSLEHPAVVMTGGLSAHYRQIRRLVEIVRRAAPQAVVVVGGGIVTASPQLMFGYLQPDMIVVGEGEVTAVELADHLLHRTTGTLDTIAGIGFAGPDGEFRLTTRRPTVKDLDALPFPDLEGFDVGAYLALQRPNDSLYHYVSDTPRFYPIISSRGCPFDCTFCFHPLGKTYRSRSVDNFMREVTHVVERYGVTHLAIFDELLATNRKRLLELCARLAALPTRLQWMCQLRVDSVDEHILGRLKEAGCFIISYGFESANEDVLRSMRKKISRHQIERALRLTRAAGIATQAYFIFGDPEETLTSARETLAFWRAHRDYHITMGYVRPYPGTKLWEDQLSRGGSSELEFLEQCTYDPPNMTAMTPAEWRALHKEVYAALLANDHFGEVLPLEDGDGREDRVRVRCAHCGAITTYSNFSQRILGVFKLVCRQCHQAMNVSPLAFARVRHDFWRNAAAFASLKNAQIPVYVVPCMDEGEFEAQRERFLDGINIAGFLDADPVKQRARYQGLEVRSTDSDTIRELAHSSGFLIPLTRFADKLYADLMRCGVPPDRVCRLDSIDVGPATAYPSLPPRPPGLEWVVPPRTR